MTIDLLRVNLDGCFAPGQAYVACSRGRSTDAMVVESFSEERIITSDLVKGFYSSLKDGSKFTPPTWAVVLESAQDESQIQKMMTKRFGSEKCQKCNSICVVYSVKNNGSNHGRWVVQCKAAYSNGHKYSFVPAPSLV